MGLWKLAPLLREKKYSRIMLHIMFNRWLFVERKSSMQPYAQRLKVFKSQIHKLKLVSSFRCWTRCNVGRKFLRWKYLLIFERVVNFKKNIKYSLKSNETKAKVTLFKLILKRAAKRLSCPEHDSNSTHNLRSFV